MPKSLAQRSATRPEKKIAYPGGIGVAIWINTINTDNGSRKVRSVTINPRRYKDPDSGEWRDAASFRPGDVPALIFALQKAQDYIYSTPLPGEDADKGGAEIPY
jgi:hypothetical protein